MLKLLTLVTKLPDWVYGKETLLRIIFMKMIIDAMHQAYVNEREFKA